MQIPIDEYIFAKGGQQRIREMLVKLNSHSHLAPYT